MPKRKESVFDVVLNVYGSLENPSFAFKVRALASRPYDQIVMRVLKGVWMQEVTDTNYDVAFEYLLRDEQQQWRLELSMVSAYAVLLRTGLDNTSKVVEPVGMQTTMLEQWLFDVLRQDDIEILSADVLSKPVPIRLTNVSPEHAQLYHALFSDVPIIPWRDKYKPVP